MDGIAAIRSYVDRLVTADGKLLAGSGVGPTNMKALLLDASTTQIVSSIYSQTELLSHDVYLVERLDDASHNPNLQSPSLMMMDSSGRDVRRHKSSSSSSSHHLKAVCFLRPTEINCGLLVRELTSNPSRFAEYHLFFTGILPSGLLRLLAENDVSELVVQVQEFYGDFLAINEDLLTFNCRHSIPMTVAAGTAWARDHAPLYERHLVGLQGMLLSLKKQPAAIRYSRSSPLCAQLARDLGDAILRDQIFHFRRRSSKAGTLLLLLDRRDDPVTPLLSQWTYQAMVHELLGLNNHRVVLRGAPNITKELEEVVLSAAQDAFFFQNRHANFGQLGERLKRLLDDYQQQTQHRSNATKNLNTIEDMQAFMERFPELRSQSHAVSKHVAIMGELARLVDICNLMDVSQLEQELACLDDHSNHFRQLLEKLASPVIKIPDKLRLGLLYALRYETSGNLNLVKSAMTKGGVGSDHQAGDLMASILRYAGTASRGPGLYGDDRDIMTKMTKSILTSVQGISNVYSQHVPVLMDILHNIQKHKLKTDTHPYVLPGTGGGGGVGAEVPSEILVFMVGGVTYEEATKVSEFNEQNKGKVQVVLAGSTIHNSTSFLEELKEV